VEGISIAYGYLETFMFLGFELPFKIPLIIPFELYILLIVGLVASIAASIAPAWYITRKRLAEILRIHH
jgi:ABC-type lipoprotein release transport system permease subunit